VIYWPLVVIVCPSQDNSINGSLINFRGLTCRNFNISYLYLIIPEFVTAILCPTPEDSINGTTINVTEFMINDTVSYQCPYGHQVTETGLIYYNLTCNLVPGTTTAVWSEHPQLEGKYYNTHSCCYCWCCCNCCCCCYCCYCCCCYLWHILI